MFASVLSNDFVVYSAYGDRQARGVSLLVKHSLGARVDLVYVDAEGWLVMANIAVSSGLLWFMHPTIRRSVPTFSVSWVHSWLILHA